MAFKPKTEKLKELATKYPDRIKELGKILHGHTAIYIDYANVKYWSQKLSWHIEPRRLYQLLTSFDTVQKVYLFYGTFVGDARSEGFITEAREIGFDVITKPVKIMHHSVDVSSIPNNSTTILEQFIGRPLLKKLNLETIEYLNDRLKELNDQGTKSLEVHKCNFDVEIGMQMLTDHAQNGYETFVLWSGDSDFADPVASLMKDKKNVYIFATARRVSVELDQTGAPIYEINKIRNFICWKKEQRD